MGKHRMEDDERGPACAVCGKRPCQCSTVSGDDGDSADNYLEIIYSDDE